MYIVYIEYAETRFAISSCTADTAASKSFARFCSVIESHHGETIPFIFIDPDNFLKLIIFDLYRCRS